MFVYLTLMMTDVLCSCSTCSFIQQRQQKHPVAAWNCYIDSLWCAVRAWQKDYVSPSQHSSAACLISQEEQIEADFKLTLLTPTCFKKSVNLTSCVSLCSSVLGCNLGGVRTDRWHAGLALIDERAPPWHMVEELVIILNVPPSESQRDPFSSREIKQYFPQFHEEDTRWNKLQKSWLKMTLTSDSASDAVEPETEHIIQGSTNYTVETDAAASSLLFAPWLIRLCVGHYISTELTDSYNCRWPGV